MASKMIVFRSDYVIGLGGNLPSDKGDPAATIIGAVAAIAGHAMVIRAVSRFYSTPCFPTGAGPDYINAAVRVAAADPPDAVLARMHEIEARFGRSRPARWAGRTLDLDILAAGDTVLPDAETQAEWRDLSLAEQAKTAPGHLILPHPRLQDRAFALVPLRDVAPGWVHPLLGRTVEALCDALPRAEIEAIRPL